MRVVLLTKMTVSHDVRSDVGQVRPLSVLCSGATRVLASTQLMFQAESACRISKIVTKCGVVVDVDAKTLVI